MDKQIVALSLLPKTEGNSFLDYAGENYSNESGICIKSTAQTTIETEKAKGETFLAPCYDGFVSVTAYTKSVGTVVPNQAMIYEFEIPQSIVGRLIGRFGTFVSKIKTMTRANIIIKRHHTSSIMKLCAIEGMCSEIEEAIGMIRDRFPLKQFPFLTLEQTNHQKQTSAVQNPIGSLLLYNNKLNLVEGVVNDVTISYALGLDIIFVQQPAHPSYLAMSRLHRDMKCTYDQQGAPKLVRPFNNGVICVTRVRKDEWYRAEVVAVQDEKDRVTARLVDIGGYVQVPIEDLRQIRVDFVTIPFQATECRLAHIIPSKPEEGWSQEAVNFFKVMTYGRVLQAQVVGYSASEASTLIYLYRLNSNNNLTLINEELIAHGYGRWISDIQQVIVPWVINTRIDLSNMDCIMPFIGCNLQSGIEESNSNPSYIEEDDKQEESSTKQSAGPVSLEVPQRAGLHNKPDVLMDPETDGKIETAMESGDKLLLLD